MANCEEENWSQTYLGNSSLGAEGVTALEIESRKVRKMIRLPTASRYRYHKSKWMLRPVVQKELKTGAMELSPIHLCKRRG